MASIGFRLNAPSTGSCPQRHRQPLPLEQGDLCTGNRTKWQVWANTPLCSDLRIVIERPQLAPTRATAPGKVGTGTDRPVRQNDRYFELRRNRTIDENPDLYRFENGSRETEFEIFLFNE